jgi:hypothetical protein
MNDQPILYDIPLLNADANSHVFLTFSTDDIIINVAVLHINEQQIEIPMTDNSFTYDVTEYMGQTYTLTLSDAEDNIYEFTNKVPQQVIYVTAGEGINVSDQNGVTSYILGQNSTSSVSSVNVANGCTLIIPRPLAVKSITLGQGAVFHAYSQISNTTNIFASANSEIIISHVEGSTNDDNLYIGADTKASYISINMLSGNDTASIASDAYVNAQTIQGVELLNVHGILNVQGDYITTETSELKINASGAFTANSIRDINNISNLALTVNKNASIEVGDAWLTKLATYSGSSLKTGKITSGNDDNTLTFSGVRYAVINGVDFRDGNDALVLNGSANVIFTGAVENLERVSASVGNRIFVTDAGYIDLNIIGIRPEIVEVINFYDIPVNVDPKFILVNSNPDLFIVDADDTYTFNGAEKIVYFNITSQAWEEATEQTVFSGANISIIKVISANSYEVTRTKPVNTDPDTPTIPDTPVDPSTPYITVNSPVNLQGQWARPITPVQLVASASDGSVIHFEGIGLPQGLTLSDDGILSGTSFKRGTFGCIAVVTSENEKIGQGQINIAITIDGPDIDLGNNIAEALVLTAQLVKQLKDKHDCSNGPTVDFTQTTATADDVLIGRYFFDAEGQLVAGTYIPTDFSRATVTPDKVLAGISFYDANGTLVEGTYIPFDTSLTTATENDVLSGKQFYNADGILSTGVLERDYDINEELETLNNKFYIINGTNPSITETSTLTDLNSELDNLNNRLNLI